MEALSTKLSQAMQDNSKLRSKLRSEMEEKYVLEQKVVSLTEKLVEAKRGLQDTSFALQKVQLVTSQLMSKKDEREMQLQEAHVLNNSLQRKLSEVEHQISDMMDGHAREMEMHMTQREKERERERENQLNQLSSPERTDPLMEQLAACREQIGALKRENFQLAEEKADALYLVEAKVTRINLLEERLRGVEAKMFMPMEWGSRESFSAQAGGGAGGFGRPTSSSDINGMPVPVISTLENKVIMLETDKSALEQRLSMLERQMSHPVLQAATQMPPNMVQQHMQQQHEPSPLQHRDRSHSMKQVAAPQPVQPQHSLPNINTQNSPSSRRSLIVHEPQSQQQVQQPPQQQPVQQPRAQPAPVQQPAPTPVAAPVYQPQQPQQQPQQLEDNTSSNTRANMAAAPVAVRVSPRQSISKQIKRVSLAPVQEQEGGSNDIIEARRAAQDAASQLGYTDQQGQGQEMTRSDSTFNGPQMARDQSAFFHSATATEQDEDEDAEYDGDDPKKKLEHEKKNAKKSIMLWYKNFVKENNREPTKMERDLYVGEIYKSYRRSSRSVKEMSRR